MPQTVTSTSDTELNKSEYLKSQDCILGSSTARCTYALEGILGVNKENAFKGYGVSITSPKFGDTICGAKPCVCLSVTLH